MGALSMKKHLVAVHLGVPTENTLPAVCIMSTWILKIEVRLLGNNGFIRCEFNFN